MTSLFGSKVLFVRLVAVLAFFASSFVGSSFLPVGGVSSAQAAVVNSIQVRGNQRLDAETIRSYVTVKPGKSYSSFDTDESLRQLYATGLFSDVRITRSGRALVVEVVENATINLVLFEGNDKVNDDRLNAIVQSKSLGIFSQEKLNSDLERVREVVRRSGRASSQVNARVDQLDNNRVNIVFVVSEGGRTKIDEIAFVGNNAFGDRRLVEVISHNESNFLSWLKKDDLFDPDRLRADEERLRRFYFNRGYADFKVVSATSDFNAAENTYSITITVDEGERYTFGSIDVDNALGNVDTALLQDSLKIETGDTYSARNVEKTLVAMTDAIATSGYAFAEVTPRGDRDFDSRTINITFFVDEGPRNYIERIDVVGNTRTRGYVIRREFDVSEGDAYNKVLVNKAKARLERLGFFDYVRITSRPGSAPDRVVVVVNVQDKPTGEFSIGGGFSTDSGAIAEVSLSEKNFLGRGQYLKLSGGYGEDTTKYQLSFTEPYFLGRRLAVGFDISKEQTDSNDSTFYDSDTFTGRLRAAAPITDNLSGSVNYTYKREELSTSLTNLSTVTQDTVDRSPFVTSSLGWGLKYSTIDNLQNPREGIYATFNQDFAGVGGDAQYIRSTGKVSAYHLLSEDADVVLFGAIGGGHIIPLGNDTLRVSDHFFVGGETIRGFETKGIGARDITTGESLGGLSYVSATAEVQFPIGILPRAYGVRGALFADAGGLFGNDNSGDSVNENNEFRASAGASIIWDSPFGPLRADFAYPLKKAEFDKTQIFRFGVSTRF